MKYATEVMIFSPAGERVFWSTYLHKTISEQRRFERGTNEIHEKFDIDIHIVDRNRKVS